METMLIYLLVYTLKVDFFDMLGGPMETEFIEAYRVLPVYDVPKRDDGLRIVPAYTAVIVDLAKNHQLTYRNQMRSSELVKWKVYEVDFSKQTTKDVTDRVKS